MSLGKRVVRLSTVNNLLRFQRQRSTLIGPSFAFRTMKRKAGTQESRELQVPQDSEESQDSHDSQISSKHKIKRVKAKARLKVEEVKAQPKVEEAKIGDYCYTETKLDKDGLPIWPAPNDQIQAAREFLKDCVSSQQSVLIVPDKDADGLSAGVIIYRTLLHMGLQRQHLDVHLVQKGSNIHDENERKRMLAKNPKFIIVLDQGSRGGPPVIDSEARCIVIDHHLSDEFPEDATVVSACHFPPVATTSLLVYEICKELHPSISDTCDYLCVIGTHGDLGNTLKWLKPFPDMRATLKKHTKKTINDCVALINAPRRTSKYDVITAWKCLRDNQNPKDIVSNKRLLDARLEIKEEVEKRTHVRPEFSKDGRIAILKIESEAQVHPIIATRWAGFLKSKSLEIIMVANYGYLSGKVNFSCRVAKCARGRDPPVNIIESLKAVADLDEGNLRARLGESFARGHKEASGGIVGTAEFEEFYKLMRVGEKANPGESQKLKKKSVEKPPQKNTLGNYFHVD